MKIMQNIRKLDDFRNGDCFPWPQYFLAVICLAHYAGADQKSSSPSTCDEYLPLSRLLYDRLPIDALPEPIEPLDMPFSINQRSCQDAVLLLKMALTFGLKVKVGDMNVAMN